MLNKNLSKGLMILITIMLTAGLALAMSHSDQLSMPKELNEFDHINTLFVPNTASPIHGIHHFYMGTKGRKAFMQGGTDEYPDGTTFVGKVYKPVKTEAGRYQEGDLAAYTMMKKDSSAKVTKKTGGWHFVMFGPDGKNKGVDPAKSCFGCHKPSPETDYVLSKPLKQ